MKTFVCIREMDKEYAEALGISLEQYAKHVKKAVK